MPKETQWLPDGLRQKYPHLPLLVCSRKTGVLCDQPASYLLLHDH